MTKLHEEFVKYGANAKRWLRQCALLLPEIARQEIWRKKGFGSIYEYAAKLAGMSKSQVDTALWVVRAVEDKPELKKVVEEKGINCVKSIVAIATKETASFWAEKATEMSQHDLEIYAKEYKSDFLRGEKTERIEMSLDPAVADQLRKMKGNRDWNTFMKELMDGQPKPEPAQTKQVPTRIKNTVRARTNGICSYPNCHKPAEELHHANRQALNPTHNPNHIHALCKSHHHLAHHSLIANEERQPHEWRLLAYPDKTNPKYQVDRLVQKYRSP